jgi:hypothetical protein
MQRPIIDPTIGVTLPTVEERIGMLRGFDANGALEAVAPPTVGAIARGTIIIPFSSTPVLNANLGSQIRITLIGNVTSSTLTVGSVAGVFFVGKVIQDAVGGHTFAWPTNFNNAGAVNTAANSTQ